MATKVSSAEEIAAAISRAVDFEEKRYTVTTVSEGVYHIESGNLCMNILCGCCAQYYAFDIRVTTNQVQVVSTVPCGGFWGGAIGVSKNRSETSRIKSALPKAFPGHQVV